MDNALNLVYPLESPLETIDLGPINNGQCNFSVQVYIDSVGSSNPISEIGLAYTMPDVQPDTINPDHFQVLSDGFIDLQSSDYSLDGQVRTVFVVVNSHIISTDTTSQTFFFTVTYQKACQTNGLQNVPSDGDFDTTYVLDDPSLVLNLSSINNGNCNFSIQVYIDYVGNPAAISDIGLIFTAPVVDSTATFG